MQKVWHPYQYLNGQGSTICPTPTFPTTYYIFASQAFKPPPHRGPELFSPQYTVWPYPTSSGRTPPLSLSPPPAPVPPKGVNTNLCTKDAAFAFLWDDRPSYDYPQPPPARPMQGFVTHVLDPKIRTALSTALNNVPGTPIFAPFLPWSVTSAHISFIISSVFPTLNSIHCLRLWVNYEFN